MNVYFTTVEKIKPDSSVMTTILQHAGLVVNSLESQKEYTNNLIRHLSDLREDLTIIIETDYVDNVYCDSYYNYFSTKSKVYKKHCLRLSLFEPIVKSFDDFTNLSDEDLNKYFLGYIILRPLVRCIGRSAISVKAKKQLPSGKNREICLCKVHSTCLGRKLIVEAFPHSSQDGEDMVCAETMLWALNEYFGNKYKGYKPILPTEISAVLKNQYIQRPVPSSGLTIQNISIALKEQGFAPMIYHNANPMFKELFTCYIESGLPLAVAVTGDAGGHAVVSIGRSEIDRNTFNDTTDICGKKYCLWNKCINHFLYNDDNQPCYVEWEFSKPTPYFSNMEIQQFVVPFHKRIYLPAELAIERSNFLVAREIKAPDDSVVKTFLTSSRTYRQYIMKSTMNDTEKKALIMMNMPKFIWVTEVSTKDEFINSKVNAIIILDATGYTIGKDPWASIICIKYDKNLILYSQDISNFKTYAFPTSSNFNCFEGNLK